MLINDTAEHGSPLAFQTSQTDRQTDVQQVQNIPITVIIPSPAGIRAALSFQLMTSHISALRHPCTFTISLFSGQHAKIIFFLPHRTFPGPGGRVAAVKIESTFHSVKVIWSGHVYGYKKLYPCGLSSLFSFHFLSSFPSHLFSTFFIPSSHQFLSFLFLVPSLVCVLFSSPSFCSLFFVSFFLLILFAPLCNLCSRFLRITFFVLCFLSYAFILLFPLPSLP